jgi:HJR/Mrr/RecB family endonuclease
MTFAMCKQEIVAKEGRISFWTGIAAYIVAFVLISLAYLWLSKEPAQPLIDWSEPNAWAYFLMPAIYALFGCIPIKAMFDLLCKRTLRSRLVAPNMRAYFVASVEFEAKLADWNVRQTEGGMSYWKAQRGVAFKTTLNDFFTRRGCKVQMTKGSGDGGIDLILHMAEKIFWCQCKGQASPIGVSVVRKIAGVCSRGGALPVVIAVNGYTKSAISTANELGVLLIDSKHLVRMAARPALPKWD